jgi:nucleotide-binding universal stress UspA family protein
MFHHILLPTDGSVASAGAARACIRFAAQVGARVTAVLVVPPLALLNYEPIVTDKALQAYGRNRDARVKECLDPIAQLGREAGVPVDTVVLEGVEPYQAILAAAHGHGCDLVMMASHGRC